MGWGRGGSVTIEREVNTFSLEFSYLKVYIQPSRNGSNIIGTMDICSRYSINNGMLRVFIRIGLDKAILMST